ncbi:MAG: alpha/beta hydrolase [Archaeoglobaceae archaeon]|nr:alpha/beta hydrolase [Archaeoglobaceae archaeon]MDW8118177.1 alpha/beta hydrolase [Archaeoglobaceae archaeon]
MLDMKDLWLGEIHAWEHENGENCVVMAHGFGAVKDLLLMYAEKFGKSFSTLLFDYRHFGRSKGEPRQLISIKKQIEDWKKVVEYAKSKYKKVALWGSSFSGGHVLEIASEYEVDAVISQVPFVDGLAVAKAMGMRSVRFAVLGVLDLLFSPFRGYKVPIAGENGLLPNDYLKLIEEHKKRYPGSLPWENSTFARITLSIPFYRPIKKVNRIKCPVFYLIAENDTVTPSEAAFKAVEKTKEAEVMSLKCGHFGVYIDFFEESSEKELEFLKKHLG